MNLIFLQPLGMSVAYSCRLVFDEFTDDLDDDDMDEPDDPNPKNPDDEDDIDDIDDPHDDDKIERGEHDNSKVSFTGDEWDCVCSSCLCTHYRARGTYDTRCFYCGHSLNDHRKR